MNVAEQRRREDSLLTWMERLIRRRRECPELGWGRSTLLDAGEPAVIAHRADWDESTILCVHSFGGEPLEVRLELGDDDVEQAVDLLGEDHVNPDGGVLTVPLAPYGYRWFRLRRRGARIAP